MRPFSTSIQSLFRIDRPGGLQVIKAGSRTTPEQLPGTAEMEGASAEDSKDTSALKRRSFEMTGEKGSDSWVRRVGARGFQHMKNVSHFQHSNRQTSPNQSSLWPRRSQGRRISATRCARLAVQARSPWSLGGQHFLLLAAVIVDEIEKCGGKPYGACNSRPACLALFSCVLA